jgi:hypothetical protein
MNTETQSVVVCQTVGESNIVGSVVVEMVLASAQVMGYAPKRKLVYESPSCFDVAVAGEIAAGVVGDAAAADDVGEPSSPVLQVQTSDQMRQMVAS